MIKPLKTTYSVPKSSHNKWKALLNGDLDVSLRNFFFQMKVTQAKNQLQKKTTTIETASKELYNLCEKYATAKNMYEDLVQIFGKEDLTPRLDDIVNQKKKEQDLATNYNTEFYKNALTQKEKELKEKDNLILNLQEEITLLKKKYTILQKGINNLKKTKKPTSKSSWSFTNLFKN